MKRDLQGAPEMLALRWLLPTVDAAARAAELTAMAFGGGAPTPVYEVRE